MTSLDHESIEVQAIAISTAHRLPVNVRAVEEYRARIARESTRYVNDMQSRGFVGDSVEIADRQAFLEMLADQFMQANEPKICDEVARGYSLTADELRFMIGAMVLRVEYPKRNQKESS